MPAMTAAIGPDSPDWSRRMSLAAVIDAHASAGDANLRPASIGAKTSFTRRARWWIPKRGKLHQISPHPSTPSSSRTRTSSATLLLNAMIGLATVLPSGISSATGSTARMRTGEAAATGASATPGFTSRRAGADARRPSLRGGTDVVTVACGADRRSRDCGLPRLIVQ